MSTAGTKKCSACTKMLPATSFSNSQLKLSPSVRKCITCINGAVIDDAKKENKNVNNDQDDDAEQENKNVNHDQDNDDTANDETVEEQLLSCEDDYDTWNYIAIANGLNVNVTKADYDTYHILKQKLKGKPIQPKSLLSYISSKQAQAPAHVQAPAVSQQPVQAPTQQPTATPTVLKKIIKEPKLFDCEQDGIYSNYNDEVLEKLIEIQQYMKHDINGAEERMNDLRLMMEQLAVVPLKECK